MAPRRWSCSPPGHPDPLPGTYEVFVGGCTLSAVDLSLAELRQSRTDLSGRAGGNGCKVPCTRNGRKGVGTRRATAAGAPVGSPFMLSIDAQSHLVTLAAPSFRAAGVPMLLARVLHSKRGQFVVGLFWNRQNEGTTANILGTGPVPSTEFLDLDSCTRFEF